MPHATYYRNVYSKSKMLLKEFMYHHYMTLKMSDISIIDMIKQKTGVKFSRTALLEWHKKTGILTRNAHERFQLAVDEGRMNYKLRKVPMKEISKYRLSESRSAPKLRDLLKKMGKSQAQLARHLNVSTATVHLWCTGEGKVLPKHWQDIQEFLGLKHGEIFKFDENGENIFRIISRKIGCVKEYTVRDWLNSKRKPRDKYVIPLKEIIENKEISKRIPEKFRESYKQLCKYVHEKRVFEKVVTKMGKEYKYQFRVNNDKWEALVKLRGWKNPISSLSEVTSFSMSYCSQAVNGKVALSTDFMLTLVAVSGASIDEPVEWGSLFEIVEVPVEKSSKQKHENLGRP